MQVSDFSVTPAIAIVLVICASMVAVATFGLCLYCFQRSSDEEWSEGISRMFSFSNMLNWNQNDGKETDEKRYINRRSVSVTTPISEEKDESVFWGKFRNWFAQPEAENVANRGLRNNNSAPALYDKPSPMGTMSVSLVQPQPQMIESDLSSTSSKRPSVYSLGARRPSERARLSSASIVPKGFKVPLEFETTPDEPTPTAEYLGRLEFSTIYIFAESTLRVKILKAFDLPAMDLTGTSDPFVKCCLLPDRKRKLETKVRRKTLNPTWNESLSFEGLTYEKIQQRVLYLQVMDHDRFSRNDPIGEIYIPLHTINLGEEIITNQLLLPCKGSNKRGELLLSLFYQPIEGILDVEIEKARNLKPMDIGGTSDPYVKIWLMYRNKRVEKKKTAIKKNSLNPVFGEVFTFSVPMGQLRDIQLEITVMDYDKVGRNDTIGKIYLGHKSTGLEKQHWKDMLSKPKEKLEPGRKPEPPGPVSQWHVLKV